MTPPGAPYDNHESALIFSMAVLMPLISLITKHPVSEAVPKGLEKWTRRLSYHPWSCRRPSFFSLHVVATIVGRVEKHMYDLTYAEFNEFISVRNHFLKVVLKAISRSKMTVLASLSSMLPWALLRYEYTVQPAPDRSNLQVMDDRSENARCPRCRLYHLVHLPQRLLLQPDQGSPSVYQV